MSAYSDKLKFWFASTGGGDFTGINDPVTTTFKGNIAYSLARESIQNILDARDPNSNKTVRSEFTLLERPANEIPQLDQLKDEILIPCRDFHKRDADAYRMYDTVISKIKDNRWIKILKISDYNTIGLTGDDDDEEGNYFSFMKAVGSTSKTGGTEGGSFGLGKGAYYASSLFRTIYVSSMFGDNNYVFQGKSRLASFKKNNDYIQGNGTFGLEGQKPVRDRGLIPDLFARQDQGTDIYILGFEGNGSWERDMIKSILNYFWYAIVKNDLEVQVGNVELTAQNIEKLLSEYFDPDRPDRTNEENPIPYFKAYNNSQHKFSKELPTLGVVNLYLLEDSRYPKRIAMMRGNGMVIYKKSIPSVAEFAGAFICENPEGNIILRKMENPEHNQWDKKNALGSQYYDKAKEAEKELKDFLNESVESLVKINSNQSARIGGLEEFLNLPGDKDLGELSRSYIGKPLDTSSEKETGSEIPVKKEQEQMELILTKQVNVVKELKEGEEGEGSVLVRGGKKGGNEQNQLGEEGEGEKSVITLKKFKYRSFATRDKNGSVVHLILLRGQPETQFSLELKAGTDDSFDIVDILHAEDKEKKVYKTKRNKIYGLMFNQLGELKLNITFNSEDKYSLNVTAYENK